MNILYVLNSKNPGGMEYHVLDLVSQMVSKGNKVYVWCSGDPMLTMYKEAGAEVFQREVGVTFGIDVDLKYILRLKKFINEYKIDVIHSHELRAVGNSLLASKISGVKCSISHMHTPFYNWQVPLWKRKFYSFAYSIAVNLLSDREIALTEYVKRIKEKSGIKSSKLSVIPNGINTSNFVITQIQKDSYREEIFKRYGIDKSKYVFGNLSRISAEKGHILLLKAFHQLVKSGRLKKQGVHLLICGGGELEESLRGEVKRLGLEKDVTITGRFDDEDKVKMYSSFDLFVFPSLAEGFGLVLVEAMVSKIPCLTSDLEVLQEVGDGSVLFFESSNVDDLTEKLLDCYNRRDRVEVMKQSAYQRVMDLYTLEKFGNAYQNLYEEVLESK